MHSGHDTPLSKSIDSFFLRPFFILKSFFAIMLPGPVLITCSRKIQIMLTHVQLNVSPDHSFINPRLSVYNIYV